jgi:hypothetical protein
MLKKQHLKFLDKYLPGGLNHETEKAISQTIQGLRRP